MTLGLGGDLAADIATLRDHLRLVADPAGRRQARADFLAVHTERVYDRLTADRTEPLRPAELVSAAARVFPGLVPDEDELAAENRLPRKGKQGLDVDLGIFFRAVLRSPRAGGHLIESALRPTERAVSLLPGFEETGRLELDRVLVVRRGAAACVEFRDPEALNAEDNAFGADMETAVDVALCDPASRVGVLRGGVVGNPRYRRVFSAGINLAQLRRGRISYVDFLLARELGYVHKLLRGNGVQKPWVAAVDTFAIGGGAQLLLVCDHVIMASDAYISLPAAQEGIMSGAANLRLTRMVGPRLARRVVLGGHRIRAQDPCASLICDEVVEPGRMDEAIDAAVGRLDSPAVLANRRLLGVAEESLDCFREYLAEFAYEQAVLLGAQGGPRQQVG